MTLLRLLFGLLVTATIVTTVLALFLGRWALAERGDVTAWDIYLAPAVMMILCLLSYRWLRRRES
nr:hypothetical protein [uncultured Sphingomonas sp.]